MKKKKNFALSKSVSRKKYHFAGFIILIKIKMTLINGFLKISWKSASFNEKFLSINTLFKRMSQCSTLCEWFCATASNSFWHQMSLCFVDVNWFFFEIIFEKPVRGVFEHNFVFIFIIMFQYVQMKFQYIIKLCFNIDKMRVNFFFKYLNTVSSFMNSM